MYLVALGANLSSPLGGPRATLEAAPARLAALGLACTARSPWYRTPAFPRGAGPDYVNGAVRIESALGPEAVLATLHAVEHELGRARDQRWGARACDLDLLAWDAMVLPDAVTVARWMRLGPAAQRRAAPARLILPHPRLHQRGFVLRPLADVAPDWVHPLLGADVRALLAALPVEALAGIERL